MIQFDRLCEEDYPPLTGLTKSEFDQVVQCARSGTGQQRLPHLYHSSPSRTPRQIIGLLMVKLKHDICHSALARLFGLKNSLGVTRCLARGEELLTEFWVPKHLGYSHVTRENIANQHTSTVARELHPEAEVIVVADGTYIYT